MLFFSFRIPSTKSFLLSMRPTADSQEMCMSSLVVLSVYFCDNCTVLFDGERRRQSNCDLSHAQNHLSNFDTTEMEREKKREFDHQNNEINTCISYAVNITSLMPFLCAFLRYKQEFLAANE